MSSEPPVDAPNSRLLSTDTVQLGGIYSLPGEGFVVELRQDNTTYLYDRQGLQYRILQRKQAGLNTDCEETALNCITNLGPGLEIGQS